MTFVEPANPRMAINPRRTRHRRTIDVLALAGTSLAFLFVLAIAFGAIGA
ncbi:MAG: hypothetical protein JWR51_1542 [Devosia sp.]|nr:hypothetical protein [Devosia sp.]MDB5528439.1 hypothetical protein [Devosia sp.]